MTVDVERILLTDTRHPHTARFKNGVVRFSYGENGQTGTVDFLLDEAIDLHPERLLQAAAACIAEYNDLIKEIPF